MTLEEYIKHAKEDEDWAPGWESIEEEFNKIYHNQNPEHFGTNLAARAIFGGDEYLDGYSIYKSLKGYKHIVTFGLTELYATEEAFGKEYSKWGYEMTIKLPVVETEECMWAISMLANLARYTFKSGRWFEPFQFIAGNGQPIKIGSDSKITALIIVKDTELSSIDTVHGKVEFMQLIGITERELQVIKEDREQVSVLIERMKQNNPMLVTDLTRTESYI